MVKNHWSVT